MTSSAVSLDLFPLSAKLPQVNKGAGKTMTGHNGEAAKEDVCERNASLSELVQSGRVSREKFIQQAEAYEESVRGRLAPARPCVEERARIACEAIGIDIKRLEL